MSKAMKKKMRTDVFTREQIVRALVASIIEVINLDPELRRCRSFCELHDHCDANMLGGSGLVLCLDGDYEEDGEGEVGIGILDEAQDRVNAWLKRKPADRKAP